MAQELIEKVLKAEASAKNREQKAREESEAMIAQGQQLAKSILLNYATENKTWMENMQAGADLEISEINREYDSLTKTQKQELYQKAQAKSHEVSDEIIRHIVG